MNQLISVLTSYLS